MVAPEHESLASMWSAGQFEPQIHHIRFPRFRNLDDGLKISFEHPITAIVGPNGTNKSSILRALQGCPDYENIGRYWFGTALDVILPEERHRFIHGRWSETASQVVEVLKTRIRRRNPSRQIDPDYFEPSRPLVGDDMQPMSRQIGEMPADRTATRWKAIDKAVVYIDFRAEISAFDKYFLHHDYRARRADSSRGRDPLAGRKQLIRDRAPKIKKILDSEIRSYKPGGREWVVEPPRALTSDEVQKIGTILGREYSKIEVVSHRAFGVAGTTARLYTGGYSYTEAWAGSGEFAAVQVVSVILNAAQHSLILLDEPEVSLHPGAQRRLLTFLATTSKKFRHQVVFATHSPVLIEDLPNAAIKVLEIDPATTRVILRSQHSSPQQAFTAIEHRFHRKTVVVEDSLSREIVLRALRTGDKALVRTVDVRVLPGGSASLLTRYLPAWASEGRSDTLLMLDGDVRPNAPYPEAQSVAPPDLRGEVERVLGTPSIDKFVPANTGGVTNEQLISILDWANRHLRFLPGDQPEAWLRTQVDGHRQQGDPKAWWEKHVRGELGKDPEEAVSSIEILENEKLRLAKLPDTHPDLRSIRDDVESFVSELP